MATPTRSPLRLVLCTSTTAVPVALWYSWLGGSSSALV
jgi:hypothetical protein